MRATTGSNDSRNTDSRRVQGQFERGMNSMVGADMNFESEHDDQSNLNSNQRPRSRISTTVKGRDAIDTSREKYRTNELNDNERDDNDELMKSTPAPLPPSPYKR